MTIEEFGRRFDDLVAAVERLADAAERIAEDGWERPPALPPKVEP